MAMTAPNGTSNGDGRFRTHRLDNGLQIVAQEMPDLESVSVCFFVRTGARDEHDPVLFGISHFLEHMVFKGLYLDRSDGLLRAHPGRVSAQGGGSPQRYDAPASG
jgi:predicted Zn-dependent peptidase